MTFQLKSCQISLRGLFILVALVGVLCAAAYYLRQSLQPVFVIDADVPGTHIFVGALDLGPVPVVLTESTVKSLLGQTCAFPRSMNDVGHGDIGLTVQSSDTSQSPWEFCFQVPGEDQYRRVDTPHGTFRTGFGTTYGNSGWRNNRFEVTGKFAAENQSQRLPMLDIKVPGHRGVSGSDIHFSVEGSIGSRGTQRQGSAPGLSLNVILTSKGKKEYRKIVPFASYVDKSGHTHVQATGTIPCPKEQGSDWLLSCSIYDIDVAETIALSNMVLIQPTDH